jgi:hypothetical protein
VSDAYDDTDDPGWLNDDLDPTLDPLDPTLDEVVVDEPLADIDDPGWDEQDPLLGSVGAWDEGALAEEGVVEDADGEGGASAEDDPRGPDR